MSGCDLNGIIPLGYSTRVSESGTHSVLSFISVDLGKLPEFKSNVAILHFMAFDKNLTDDNKLNEIPLNQDLEPNPIE